jgi:CelD/BcsL family acetyltransferase involved in cellulose biosynthesis
MEGADVTMPFPVRSRDRDDTPVSARAFSTIEVHTTTETVAEAWACLERDAPCSIYQTRSWLLPWLATLGRRAALTPWFVLARSADGTPAALLPLGLVRRGPITIATWLGGKDSNAAMPLVRPGVAWTAADARRLLLGAVDAAGRRPDVFVLGNQPHMWGGTDNPLALLPHGASPSVAYGTALPPRAADLFEAKLSKDSRKKLRKKEAKLALLGPLTHRVAVIADEQRETIDVFLRQKTERFRDLAIASDFETPEMRAFIETASAPHGGGIEVHAMLVGERIVAVYGGASWRGHWSGMFNSFDADEEIAKSSPGDLLLMRIIEKACADGMTQFDLGIGEARYKAALCDEAIPLFDLVMPTTAKGRLFAALVVARQATKRSVKRDPRLLAWVKTVQGARNRFARKAR